MEPAELMFGESADPGQVFAALATRYGVHAEPSSAGRWTCVDTADWRLHHAGMTLRDARRGRSAQLVLSTAEHTSLTAPAPPKHWPRRIETLPVSPVRERIEPAVGVRALLPLAEVDVRSVVLRLLDDERKTRVRVRVDQQRLSGTGRSPLPLRVVVAPVRGYERDGERCSELLAESMTPLPAALTAASVAMTAAGHKPGAPVVPAITLDASAPAPASLARVLRRWIDVIDAARPGVLADVD
ncbi:MAG TPA: hypothetical protein VKQ07_10230, partial [Jatrophihabitantaceae bacterium]|nr:hypothetical protein [Jatrophihabitantaceae bacterium]